MRTLKTHLKIIPLRNLLNREASDFPNVATRVLKSNQSYNCLQLTPVEWQNRSRGGSGEICTRFFFWGMFPARWNELVCGAGARAAGAGAAPPVRVLPPGWDGAATEGVAGGFCPRFPLPSGQGEFLWLFLNRWYLQAQIIQYTVFKKAKCGTRGVGF